MAIKGRMSPKAKDTPSHKEPRKTPILDRKNPANACMYTCVSMCVRMFVYTYACTCMHASVYVLMSMYMQLYAHTNFLACQWFYKHLHSYCMCIFKYKYVYAYTLYTFTAYICLCTYPTLDFDGFTFILSNNSCPAALKKSFPLPTGIVLCRADGVLQCLQLQSDLHGWSAFNWSSFSYPFCWKWKPLEINIAHLQTAWRSTVNLDYPWLSRPCSTAVMRKSVSWSAL